MPWSTRQLADLAGTTVKTIRYYHQEGLLEEPERAPNGYKQYEVPHLVRLLHVRRLVGLGVPLTQIAAMDNTDTGTTEALRIIDAELAATIDRLQVVRSELAVILSDQVATDLPEGFGAGAAELSEADRSLMMIYSKIFTPTAMDDIREMALDANRQPIDTEFDSLPDTADDSTRQDLAVRYAPYIQKSFEDYPWLATPGTVAPRGTAFVGEVIAESVGALYNTAQLDVLARAMKILQEGAEGAATD
ncbi:MAG TPA: MerR family transcriptional regulator [Glaciihabitans sp.]|nr:MerR family transcriptional regulator [Glaciihabitans sp.]